MTENTSTREVYLSLRDIVAITGLIGGLVIAVIGSAVSVKVDIGRLTERLGAIDRRVDFLENLLSRPVPARPRGLDNPPSGE